MSREPEVGDYLYSSCTAAAFGRVVKVGLDGNGKRAIDVLVIDRESLLDALAHVEEDSRDFHWPSCTKIELPPGDVYLVDVQWRALDSAPIDTRHMVELATPGHGCFRCVRLFELRKELT